MKQYTVCTQRADVYNGELKPVSKHATWNAAFVAAESHAKQTGKQLDTVISYYENGQLCISQVTFNYQAHGIRYGSDKINGL
jgi:hypothetical protein